MDMTQRRFAIIVACLKGHVLVMEHQAGELAKLGEGGKARAHIEFCKEVRQIIDELEKSNPVAARRARENVLILPPRLRPQKPETY